MGCEHDHMSLIYSDHETGYIDISWCPDCGALEVKDEDDYQFRTIEAQPQDSAEVCKIKDCHITFQEDGWAKCPLCMEQLR